MPGLEGFKKFLQNADARTYATPLGALLGLTAVRTLAPKSKRNWKTYGLGAAAGAGAGLAAGTAVENLRGAKQELARREGIPSRKEELRGGVEDPEAQAIQKRYEAPDVKLHKVEGEPSAEHQKLYQLANQAAERLGFKNAPHPEEGAEALNGLYVSAPVATKQGYDWFTSKPTRGERYAALAAQGGVAKATEGVKAAGWGHGLAVKGLGLMPNNSIFGMLGNLAEFARQKGKWTKRQLEVTPMAEDRMFRSGTAIPFAEAVPQMFGADMTTELAGIRRQATDERDNNPRGYASRMILYSTDLNNSLGNVAAYQQRKTYLSELKGTNLPLERRQQLNAFLPILDSLIVQENEKAAKKWLTLQVWAHPEIAGPSNTPGTVLKSLSLIPSQEPE